VEEHKLLIECFCGETEIDDVFELKRKITSNLEQLSNINVLVDIQKNTSNISFKKLDQLIEYYLKSDFTSKIECMAIVADTPDLVAKTMLFIEGVKHLKTPIKTFSAVKPAVNWLHADINAKEIQNLLKNCKK